MLTERERTFLWEVLIGYLNKSYKKGQLYRAMGKYRVVTKRKYSPSSINLDKNF